MRIQSMNGVNLEKFQFEYDLTWMSFFQNGEGRTYTRYGGRDDAGPETYLNKESLLGVMRQVLKLHKDGDVQPTSRYEPNPKKESTPADVPTMKAMMSNRKESCIHCHDVKVARLRHQHQLGTLKKEMIYTYPTPTQLGIVLDPKTHNLVQAVTPDSPAAAAGLQQGDSLLKSDGQRLISYADITRVLEFAPDEGALELTVSRDGKAEDLAISLPVGWRVSKDPSWRASVGVVGPGAGFWGRPADDDERKRLKVGKDDLALKITFIWAPHAKATGVKVNDFVLDLDGKKNNMSMRQFHAHLQLNRNWSDKVPMLIRRGDQDLEFVMDLPSGPPKNP